MRLQRLRYFRNERHMLLFFVLCANDTNAHMRDFFVKSKILPNQLSKLLLPQSSARSHEIHNPANAGTRDQAPQFIIGKCPPHSF